MPIKLYTHSISGNAFKARLLAALLDIPLDEQNIDIFANEQHTPEYLAINPRHKVPALVDTDRGVTLTDSASILIYLAGSFSDKGEFGKGASSFWSNDSIEQAKIVNWVMFAATHIIHLARSRLMWSILIPKHGEKEEFLTELNGHREPGVDTLNQLEQNLKENQWLALDRPTIADIANYPYVAAAPMGNFSLEDYPAVRAWLERVQKLPRYLDWPGLGLQDPLFLRREKGLA